MTISVWGWGSCCGAISTWGWGVCCCYSYIPEMWAKYLGDSYAYSCVLTRGYIEVQSRARGTILLRVNPSSIPERYRVQVVQRIVTSMAARSRNIQISQRNYVDILSRLRGDVALRTPSGKVTERSIATILQRVSTDVSVRSPGWPFQSGEICE